MNCSLASLVALLALLPFTATAKADTAGISFVSPGPLGNNASGYSLGYQFTANTDLTVTALGYFDYGGLVESHQVGLYNAKGKLLATTVVDGTGMQDGFFNYSAIAPLTLVAGKIYQVVGMSGLVDAYTYNTEGFAVDPEITLQHDVFAMGNTMQFGNRTEEIDGASGGAFFGANFEASAVTPEPGSLVLLGSGLAGMAALTMRRRLA